LWDNCCFGSVVENWGFGNRVGGNGLSPCGQLRWVPPWGTGLGSTGTLGKFRFGGKVCSSCGRYSKEATEGPTDSRLEGPVLEPTTFCPTTGFRAAGLGGGPFSISLQKVECQTSIE